MASGNVWLALAVTAVLIGVNGMLASSEIAMMGLSSAKLRAQAEAGDKKARQLADMKENPSDFLSTIQVGITLAGLLSGAFAADTLAQPIVAWAAGLGLQGVGLSVVGGVATFLITLVMTYFMLVFGELVPKRVAMARPEATARRIGGAISGLSRAARPLVRLLSASTNGVLRLLGVGSQDESPVTEEDILLMMLEGRQQGAIEDSEVRFMENLFEFTDLRVRDAMTHRTEVEALPLEGSFADIMGIMARTGFNKFMVADGDIDHIVGAVYSKDIVAFYAPGADRPTPPTVRQVMRPPYFVPESKRLVELFADMKENHERIAVAVDEYGGTAGIITLMDIIEELVGDIEATWELEMEQVGEHEYRVSGTADLEDVFAFLDIRDEPCDRGTLGGFLLDRLGYVPQAGQTPEVSAYGFSFRVEAMAGGRVDRVLIRQL